MALAAALSAGCGTLADRADRVALAHGYQRLQLEGATFRHVAYFKPGNVGTTLNVYIEHDGVPWITPERPADDPTPRRLVMLNLMAGDPAPALYLGRPCYFGFADTPPCEAVWWTHRRFSAQVIRSMEAALSGFLGAHPEYRSVQFLGYSGGGVVAALMAGAFPMTRRLVTVAAPLDLDAWARLHHYSPLEGSIDPSRQSPLPDSVIQLHLAGADDSVVPDYLIEPFVMRQGRANFVKVPGVDHYCCWDAVWAGIVLAH